MTERVHNGWLTVFAWDGFNRMTAAIDRSGITTTFSYDALGRWLSKSSGDSTDLHHVSPFVEMMRVEFIQ